MARSASHQEDVEVADRWGFSQGSERGDFTVGVNLPLEVLASRWLANVHNGRGGDRNISLVFLFSIYIFRKSVCFQAPNLSFPSEPRASPLMEHCRL